MDSYFKTLLGIYQQIKAIKTDHMTEYQAQDLAITNLGEENTQSGGMFCYVAQTMRDKNTAGTLKWKELEATMQDAELHLKPRGREPRDKGPATDKQDSSVALHAEVKNLRKQVAAMKSRRPAEPNTGTVRKQGTCWNCGAEGHHSYECSKKKRNGDKDRDNKDRRGGRARNDRRDRSPRAPRRERSPTRTKDHRHRRRSPSSSSGEEAFITDRKAKRRGHKDAKKRRRSTSWSSHEGAFVTSDRGMKILEPKSPCNWWFNMLTTLLAMVMSGGYLMFQLPNITATLKLTIVNNQEFIASLANNQEVIAFLATVISVTVLGYLLVTNNGTFGLQLKVFQTTVQVTEQAFLALNRAFSFVIDSGASTHVICSQELAKRMTNKQRVTEIIHMNSHPERIEFRGDLRVKIRCRKSGKGRWVTLHNVAYVPTSRYNLFSETAYLDSNSLAQGAGASVCHTKDGAYIEDHNGFRLYGGRAGNLYKFDLALIAGGIKTEESTPVKHTIRGHLDAIRERLSTTLFGGK